MCSLNFDLNFLYHINPDEWAFHGSLLRIKEGMLNLNPRLFYGTGFFNYGHLFFLLNFILTFPFLISENFEMVVIIPRIFSSISAVFSLIFINKIIKTKENDLISFFSVLLLILLPAFWLNSIVFHPDWPYTLFIILSVYYLKLDNNQLGKNFNLSIVFFSISFCLKLQAIIFVPIIILYALRVSENHITRVRVLIKLFLFLIVARIVTNPYLLHPEGFESFIEGFVADMNSNKTNHGLGNTVDFYDKIMLINNYYINSIILFITLSFYLFRGYFFKSSKLNFSIFSTVILNLLYLLIFVNKAWQHYYLTLFVLFILLLSDILSKSKYYKIIFSLIFLIQINPIYGILKEDETLKGEHKLLKEDINMVTNWLKLGGINSNNTILIHGNISVKMDALNLNYKNIHRTWGSLDRKKVISYNNHEPGDPILKDYVLIKKNLTKSFGQILAQIPRGFCVSNENNKYILLKKTRRVNSNSLNLIN